MSVFQEKVNPYYCFMRGYTRGLCPSARCPFAPGTGLRGVLPLYEGPPSLVQFAHAVPSRLSTAAWHRRSLTWLFARLLRGGTRVGGRGDAREQD